MQSHKAQPLCKCDVSILISLIGHAGKRIQPIQSLLCVIMSLFQATST